AWKIKSYANWPWTPTTIQQHTAELKILAKDALQHLWVFQDAYKAAEAEVSNKVALIIVTPTSPCTYTARPPHVACRRCGS
ncbi:MAG: hypothetical protein ACKPKO_54750, partial [Candidatus Fonsibacter sp.]